MKPQIVNIINFIRGAEPRLPELDLVKPVVGQIRLLKRYKLPGTFLLQYDALMQDRFIELLKAEPEEGFEIGIWLEIVKPLVEKAGLEWRGREGFSWDWHSDVGFSVGYRPEERERLIDIVMEDFRRIFGSYPKSVGSWLIDAHSLGYMADKYKITASCNCKDQWGTDGYTLWGGYYNQAYYPSRSNVFSPAQNRENQIRVPVFRMLGSDPIYQYDAGMDDESNPSGCQPVITLEPVYARGGGSPEWVRWFFRENFNGTCLSFGYAQAGQENSFGWEAMSNGLADQMALIAEKAKNGEVRVETLRSSAEWFKANYDVTPASVVAALSDWKNEGRKSIWYSSRFYRVNFYMDKENIRIRDIQLFDENYRERYIDSPCKAKDMVYDNLPVMDGNRWSSDHLRAGIRFVAMKKGGAVEELTVESLSAREINGHALTICVLLKQGGNIFIHCYEKEISINFQEGENCGQLGLYFQWSDKAGTAISEINHEAVKYIYNGHKYSMRPVQGRILKTEHKNRFMIYPDHQRITLGFDLR